MCALPFSHHGFNSSLNSCYYSKGISLVHEYVIVFRHYCQLYAIFRENPLDQRRPGPSGPQDSNATVAKFPSSPKTPDNNHEPILSLGDYGPQKNRVPVTPTFSSNSTSSYAGTSGTAPQPSFSNGGHETTGVNRQFAPQAGKVPFLFSCLIRFEL